MDSRGVKEVKKIVLSTKINFEGFSIHYNWTAQPDLDGQMSVVCLSVVVVCRQQFLKLQILWLSVFHLGMENR